MQRHVNSSNPALLPHSHSKGAIESILYAAKYDDVGKIISISARYNMMHGISGVMAALTQHGLLLTANHSTERFGDDVFERLRRGGFIEMRHRDGRTWKLTQEVCVPVLQQALLT